MEANKNKITTTKDTYLGIIRALKKETADVTAFSLSRSGMCIIFSPNKTFLNQLSGRIKEFLLESINKNLPVTFDYTTSDKTVVLLDNLLLADEEDITQTILMIKSVIILSAQDVKYSTKTFIEVICECFDVQFELFNLETHVKFNKFILAELLCSVIFEYLDAGKGTIKICSYYEAGKFVLELQFENIKNRFSFEINSCGEMVFDKYLNNESMLCANTHF